MFFFDEFMNSNTTFPSSTFGSASPFKFEAQVGTTLAVAWSRREAAGPGQSFATIFAQGEGVG